MKNVIAWIKLNPISVASIVLIVLSLAAMGYFAFMAGPALRDQALTQPKKDIDQLRRYGSQSIEVPPANADDPPERKSGVTINAATIQVLDQIYQDLNGEAREILDVALQINQPGHPVLVPGLFPDTPSPLRFPAKRAYGDVLGAMLGGAERAATVEEDTGLAVPYLNAGRPLPLDQVQASLDQKRSEALQGADMATMTEERRRRFVAEQQRELMNLLLNHARTINLYADPDLGNILSPNPAFPLQVSTLGTTPESPQPAELWEGQLELWILQDIVRAIAYANRVGEPDADVLTSPVKRLLRAEVLPGYVGLHTMGGVGTIATPTGSAFGATSRAQPRRSRSVAGGGGGYAPPAGGMTDQPRETKLADNFAFGPTGRSSNSIYDVRHARLHIHADFQRLPEIFNAISQVNLMTVIDAQVRGLDEYAALQELYAYGAGDIVDVELIIETIWLRDWTAQLMPQDVKVYVGLAPPPTGTGPGGMDAYGGYGGYDPYGGAGGYAPDY